MSLFSLPTHGPHRKKSHQDLPTRISCRNDGLVILSREGYHPRLHIPSLKAQREKSLLDLCVPLEKTSDFHSRFVTSLATQTTFLADHSIPSLYPFASCTIIIPPPLKPASEKFTMILLKQLGEPTIEYKHIFPEFTTSKPT